MISKRDVLIELLWLVGILVISFVLIYFLKQNVSFFKDGDIGLHDTYLVIDNSYSGLLFLIFVPIAYLILTIRAAFTKLKSVFAIIILLLLNLFFISFNSHRLVFFMVFLYNNYLLPIETTGWTITYPNDDGELAVPNANTGIKFLMDNIDLYYTIVLLVLCLSLIFFSYHLALKVKVQKS